MFGVCVHVCVLVEINAFIHMACIKLIKSDSKDIYNVNIRFLFQINAVLLNFLFICES